MSAIADRPTDSRRESRCDIESIVLPFLGTIQEDYSPFQYLLSDMSMHGAMILLPRWLSLREKLHKGDVVDFHAPFRFAGETFSSGKIVWERWDQDSDAQACGVYFETRTPVHHPVAISFDEQSVTVDLTDFRSPGDMMLRVLKDAILLKRGVRIYLKHLAPYLSRISGADKEQYAFLRQFLIEDAMRHVERNLAQLQAVHGELAAGLCTQEELAACVSVEDLLGAFEPEIPADVFALAFTAMAVAPYLRSIKILEKKLYWAYNSLMMLYIQSV